MNGLFGEVLWNIALLAATTLVATVTGALIGWKKHKAHIEKFVEGNRRYIIPVTALILVGLVGVWAQRYFAEEPERHIELSPARQQFDPSFGYYWICAGDITIINRSTEAKIEARAFADKIPLATPKATGIVTTIDLVDVPVNASGTDISVFFPGDKADCWSATDDNRIYVESSINQLVKESPGFICGQSKCDDYIPYYPDMVALMLGTPEHDPLTGTPSP